MTNVHNGYSDSHLSATPAILLAASMAAAPITHILFTARKRSLGQGNIFTPVCHSVHGQVHPPGRYTPWNRYTPQTRYPPGQVHPLGRYTPQVGTPPDQVHPLDQVHPPGDTGNKRAVRILLECILVEGVGGAKPVTQHAAD